MDATAAPWTLIGVEAGHLLFSYTDTPPTFQTGQFLANAAPGKKDEIFYRKVLSTTDNSGAKEITVYTKDVRMLEIVGQASVLVASPQLGVYLITQQGVLVQGSGEVTIGGAISHTVDFSGTPVSYTLSGDWSFTPKVTVAFDIQGNELEDFFFRYEGSSEINVNATIAASGGYTKTVTTPTLLSYGHVYYFGQAGPVPLWGDLNFSLVAEAGVDLDAEASFTTGMSRSRSVYFQVRYSSTDSSKNKWTQSEPEGELPVEPSFDYHITGTAKAWAKLIPEVKLKLNSLFGVEANIVPKVGFNGEAEFLGDDPIAAEFDLYGRVDFNAGLSVIGLDSGNLPSFPSVNLVNHELKIKYPEPEELIFETQPEDQTAEEGGSAVFTALALDNSPITYHWYHNERSLMQSSASLIIHPVTKAKAGTYQARAISTGETLWSEPVTLTVLPPGGSAPGGMVRIPGGTNAGTDPDYGDYSLTVDSFYMDRTEVTKAQWDVVYNWAIVNGYSFANAGSGKAADHPVHTVTWYDCVKWCNARSEKEGKTPCYDLSNWSCDVSANGYRLPTNDEWEYAARGGSSGKRFPWGDTITHSQANYYSYSYSYDVSPTRGYHPDYDDGETPYTSPSGTFSPNGYGLCDMAGNVWEWCNTTSGSARTIRGGCWGNDASFARCGYRSSSTPSSTSNHFGLRVVCR